MPRRSVQVGESRRNVRNRRRWRGGGLADGAWAVLKLQPGDHGVQFALARCHDAFSGIGTFVLIAEQDEKVAAE